MILFAPIRWAWRIGIIVLAGMVLYFGVTLAQVWLTSRRYEPHPAGAVVVMGAAQYDCVPSPDLRSRLNEAFTLLHQGDARMIIVTGNKRPGDTCTEAESGARYLEAVDHVAAADILQAGGGDSYDNIAEAASVLEARHIHDVLITTDPFHEDRSMAIASNFSLVPSPTPTRNSPIRGWSTVPYFTKEAVGVGLGRIIGFNHLEWLHAA